jgi:hypothetical protein
MRHSGRKPNGLDPSAKGNRDSKWFGVALASLDRPAGQGQRLAW